MTVLLATSYTLSAWNSVYDLLFPSSPNFVPRLSIQIISHMRKGRITTTISIIIMTNLVVILQLYSTGNFIPFVTCPKLPPRKHLEIFLHSYIPTMHWTLGQKCKYLPNILGNDLNVIFLWYVVLHIMRVKGISEKIGISCKISAFVNCKSYFQSNLIYCCHWESFILITHRRRGRYKEWQMHQKIHPCWVRVLVYGSVISAGFYLSAVFKAG